MLRFVHVRTLLQHNGKIRNSETKMMRPQKIFRKKILFGYVLSRVSTFLRGPRLFLNWNHRNGLGFFGLWYFRCLLLDEIMSRSNPSLTIAPSPGAARDQNKLLAQMTGGGANFSECPGPFPGNCTMPRLLWCFQMPWDRTKICSQIPGGRNSFEQMTSWANETFTNYQCR